jgi:hypothetical protein
MSRHAGARAVSAALLAALVLAAPGARAQLTKTGDAQHAADPSMDVRTTRSGLVVSVVLGFGVAGASGYPNNYSQIGDPNYYSSSNLMLGTGSALFIGGALADWINFGFWFGSQRFHSRDWQSTGSGGGFRVEVFPLFALYPTLKNLAVEAQFGLGGTSLQALGGDYPKASGTQSFIGIGSFYEFTLFHALGGHGVLGPELEYDNVYSTAIARGSGILGLRFAFYGGM